MKREEFITAVELEVKSLKEHATKEELERLDFDTFSFNHNHSCIYGQMTGSCKSKRSKELMDKSCIKSFSSYPSGLAGKSFSKVKEFLFNSNNSASWEPYNRDTSFLSALEGYICLKGSKNEHIISFLKGETKFLKL